MNDNGSITRRGFLAGSLSVTGAALAGCGASGQPGPGLFGSYAQFDYDEIYGPRPNERFPIPAIKLERVPRRYYRQRVSYSTRQPAGSLIVDTRHFYLYLVQGEGKAMRYGVGLGRAGFEWSGKARIGRKQRWPTWTPPQEMIEREPYLVEYSAANGGMEPGLYNPLGARALYLYQGNKDTLYRIHGSPEYWTIGKAVSSGCVRMMNQDVIDLYDRVSIGAQVVVI